MCSNSSKVLSEHDNGDKKSLDNLKNKLRKLQREAQKGASNSKNSSSLKNPSLSSSSHKNVTTRNTAKTYENKSPKRKRLVEVDEKNKITSWLNKENQVTQEVKRKKAASGENSQIFSERKMKPLDVTVNKKLNTKGKTRFERNSSFEKYGVVMPSYEKIVEDQKKLDDYKNQVRAFDALDEGFLSESFDVNGYDEVEQFSGEILDCKHLSIEKLQEEVSKHLQTLKDICNGKKYSGRHQRFHKHDMEDFFTAKDLRCSTSLVVFTQEQKEYMLEILRLTFDPDDKMTSYFFKVLLPELCLLIFMDVHKMSKKKANSYLDKRPLDI